MCIKLIHQIAYQLYKLQRTNEDRPNWIDQTLVNAFRVCVKVSTACSLLKQKKSLLMGEDESIYTLCVKGGAFTKPSVCSHNPITTRCPLTGREGIDTKRLFLII